MLSTAFPILAFVASVFAVGVIADVRENADAAMFTNLSPISDSHMAGDMDIESSVDSIPYDTQANVNMFKQSDPFPPSSVLAIPLAQYRLMSEDGPQSVLVDEISLIKKTLTPTFDGPTFHDRQIGGYRPQTSSMTLAASLSSILAPAESSNLMEAASALYSQASAGAAYASQISVAGHHQSAAEYSMGAAYVSWAADLLEASAKGKPYPSYPIPAQSVATSTQTLVASFAVAVAILGLAIGL